VLSISAKSVRVAIQFSSGGGFRTVKTVTLRPATGGCYFNTAVTFSHSGSVRLLYLDNGSPIISRSQAITIQ
jgi:hypothetical protein